MSSTLVADWKHPRTSKAFTALPSAQGVTLACVSNTTIPCTAREFQSMGKTRFTATILEISPGFAFAPYKKQQGNKKTAKDPNAKPLFELVKDQGGVSVRLYAFKKAKSNFDRDERDDAVVSHLHVGQVISFFVHGFMYEAKESNRNGVTQQNYIFPQEVEAIPPFTVLQMQLMISNNQTEGGYGLKLQRVSIKNASLYSYQEQLRLLPGTDEAAKSLAEDRSRANPFIQSHLEVSNVAFYARAPAGAFISAEPVCPGFHRVVGPDGAELFPGVPCLDVSVHDLLRYSNTLAGEDAVPDAITLLDFASAASALSFYVVSARSYKQDEAGEFRGVPLVDVDEFLRPVQFTEETGAGVFPAPFTVAGLDPLQIEVTTVPVTRSPPLALAPPCEDFSIISRASRITRAYYVAIGTLSHPEILAFAFNATGCPSASTLSFQRLDYAQRGLKRKEPASPEDE